MCIVVALVLGILGLFWIDITPEQQRAATGMIPKLLVYAAAGFVVCLFLFSSMLKYFFKEYIDPLVNLANETQLIAVADASYRIPELGGPEVALLTGVINDLAAKHVALKHDVQQIVSQSKAEVQDEKQRLEALTAQMPDGVVVCNLDGRMLLYNHRAQEIVERPEVAGNPGGKRQGYLGLGRSIFGVFDRRPVVQALNVLQSRLDREGSRTPFTFVTTLHRDQFIRVRLSAIVASGTTEIEGYVLMLADITERIRADSRRDMFLQSLTIGLQEELSRIREAANALLRGPAAAGVPVVAQGQVIEMASSTLLERIDSVAMQHATRLQDPGEAEFILGLDLIEMLRETVVDDFQIECATAVTADVWLQMNSYTVVRGVVYLLGQLTQHLAVRRVELELATEDGQAFLVVRWQGDPVKLRTIEQWKECPLMMGGSGKGPVSLTTLLTGRGDVRSTAEGDEEAVSVRFLLEQATEQAQWTADTGKEVRPVYYDFKLFEESPAHTDKDGVRLSELTYVVFDTETTGLEPSAGDEIISLGAVRIVRNRLRREEVFDQLVDPQRSIPLQSLRIHEISPEMLRGMSLIAEVLADFHRFSEGAVLVAHNAAFDMKFVKLKEQSAGVVFDNPALDTLLLSAVAYPTEEPHNLEALATRLGVPIVGRHTALGDAILAAEVLVKLIPLLEAKGIVTLAQAREASRNTPYSAVKF